MTSMPTVAAAPVSLDLQGGKFACRMALAIVSVALTFAFRRRRCGDGE